MTGSTLPHPAAVRMVWHKWRGGSHWERDALLLGTDGHGTWIGSPSGTLVSRPGVEFRSERSVVTLLPEDRAFVASLYAPGGAVEVYVDISTPPTWSGTRVSAVDLDLDVVRGWTGRTWVDDEDEFAEHRVTLGYPDHVVAMATRSCEEVLDAVRRRLPPYDGTTGSAWLDRLEEMVQR